MRHARIQQAKPERSFAERIVAVIVAIAMLGGMGYATTSAAMAQDAGQTLEQQAGISLRLHDYDRKTINDDHALKFMSVGNPGTYNGYVGSGKGAYTGIVNTTLTNGYPTMADGTGSLDYLFGEESDSVVKNYEPTGGLLTLDKKGYYGFDADSQYAAYDTTSKTFNRSPQNYCTNQTDTTPCFAPFGHDTADDKYSFGMNLGAEFYMPEGGKVNNQAMVFEFTGDDDVWVFIDGVLVLDLGGIHQALDGSINFATGDITYDKTQSHGDAPAGTITQAFKNAGEKWDPTLYKTHHLSFFYLERGDGGSNCKIKFNLPVKPSKAIDIEKETLGTIDENKQFQFQLFVDGSKDPYQGKYSVYNVHTNQVVDSDVLTEGDGVIKLTRGQFARVQDNRFTDDTRYTVRELNSSGYTVSANGSPMTQQGGGNAYAETGSFTVGTTSHVTIVNSNVKPSNNKRIVKTDDGYGDEYTLYLTASGESTSSTVTAVTPADIVLVMDKSGSMNEDNRDTNAQKAANALAEKLLTDKNSMLSPEQQVQMAVVTFSTKASLKQEFTTNALEINAAVKGNPDGGTNWEAALNQANGLSGRPGVKKYIIFLSDGNPTYRTSSYDGSCYSRWGRPRPKYTTETDCVAAGQYWEDPDDVRTDVHGSGGSDDYGYNYAAALAEANRRGDAALYVVKTSTEANKMADFAAQADAVDGKEFDGTNATNLTNAFNQIYSSITSSAKIKVFSITDTLSKWVDPVKFAGVANGADITQYVTVKNGSTTMSTSEYTAIYSVDNSGSRTVTVTFNGANGIVAEKTDVIDVSFKVKPSDAAYADYAENKRYPDMGDADTGDASAEQRGYYSNADAKLKYCVLTEVNNVESCAPTEAEYPHPVVQVKLGKINITKQWKGSGEHADSVTVQLRRKVIDADDSTAQDVGAPITLNAGNKWTATVDNLLPGYTYSVVENSIDDRYDVSYFYAGNNAALTKEMVWSSNADAGTLNTTITNTLKTVSLSNAISVKKNLTGREWKDSDQFDFTLAAENNAPLPTRCMDQQPCTVTVTHDSTDHTKSFGDITYNAGGATYTYYVTENSGPISALHYSQAKYKVVATVAKNDTGAWTASVTSVTKMLDDNGETVSEAQSDSTQPVAFTNHYIAVSALPLTGGMTDRQWLFVGGAVGGLAVLLIGAAGVWNGKKRLV